MRPDPCHKNIRTIKKVISGIRNLKELKYPYGYKTKERFRVRGQLFTR
ncbi:MAG: hypothetical protein UW39_C0032G0001, partial [Parcubacteria group bacterium GW2011_GWC2_44_17]